MGSDTEMVDDSRPEEVSTVDGHALIKVVRSLDQGGPGEDGQNLERLWRALSLSSAGQFYAAEQSSLRWLLKVMNPSSKASTDSETIRRYPLTWNVLNCVFQRIPLFSLAKALADRRFITVLRQTVKDIAEPAVSDDSPPSSDRKRKRSGPVTFNINSLRKPEGCVQSSDALLEALGTLLSRLSTTSEMSTRDAVGAEHIKSLFASPATEALETVGPLFTVCANSVGLLGADFDNRASWVRVVSEIWDLRLRGKADSVDVATHVAKIVLPIFGKLDTEVRRIHRGADSYSELPSRIRRSWAADLRDFLQRNVLLPARAAFMASGDLDVLNTAVLMTRRTAEVTSPALYLLAQNSPKPLDEKSKGKVLEWMNEVVKAVEGTLSNVALPTRIHIVEGILGEAQKHETKIDENLLMSICLRHGFESGSIHWKVVSAVLKLDPDMMMDGDRGQKLMSDIITNIHGFDASEDESARHVMRTLEAIITAFTNAKDLTGYLKLWYEELCKTDDARAGSPWLHPSIRYDSSVFSKEKLELEITVKQLQEFLEWLGSQAPIRPECLYVVLDSIANGLQSAEFTDIMGPKIAELVVKSFPTKSSQSSLLSLRWSILERIMPWLAPEARDALWDEVKDALVDVLGQGKLSDEDTLQALQFSFTTWFLMTPDGDRLTGVSSTTLAAAERLSKEIPTKVGKKSGVAWDGLHGQHWPSNDYVGWYIEFVLCNSSLALPLLSRGNEEERTAFLDKLSKFLLSADKKSKSKSNSPERTLTYTGEAFSALLSNENVLNNRPLLDYVIDSMSTIIQDRFKKSEDELLEEKVGRIFLSMPNDCLTRPQREHLFDLLLRRIQAVSESADVSPAQWKLVLAVLTKIMKRPTFHEELGFGALVMIAEKASRCFATDLGARGWDVMRSLVTLYYELAAAVMLQMANHRDTRGQKFFEEAASYVQECPVDEKHTHRARLHLVLLKALIAALSGILSLKEQVPLAHETVQLRLADAITGVLQKCAKYWKKKPQELSTGSYLYTLLTALDAAEVVSSRQFEGRSVPADQLVQASGQGIQSGRLYGWKLRAFLLKHYPATVEKVLYLAPTGDGADKDGAPLDVVRERDLIPLVLQCTETTLQTLSSDKEKLLYLRDLLEKVEFGSDVETQLTAVRCVVAKLSAFPPSAEFKEFDLATAYTILARKALQANNGARFGRVCEILHVILDGVPGHICQWNVEETLVLVSTVCAEDPSVAQLKDSERTFKHLCKLVEAILKKYRLRLEGHFHLLIATLQSLLRALLLHPYDSHSKNWANPPLNVPSASYDAWEAHATAYNRLLTLVCEPTVGSVTRSHHGGALDAATDVAKRAAGRQMYLVLMAYVRLQMEVGVPRGVREAIEGGVNAVFDVTPGEVRKVMNDGLDRAGREMVGDLYRRYRTFGKWSGK